jgi:hypothetical protein
MTGGFEFSMTSPLIERRYSKLTHHGALSEPYQAI